MLTFTLRRADGTSDTTEYHSVVVNLPGGLVKLALHKDGNAWALSDPASGYRILTVKATYKGMPVASDALGLAQARRAARTQFTQLVERIGLDKMRQAFSNARARAFVPVPMVTTSDLMAAAQANGKLVMVHVGGPKP